MHYYCTCIVCIWNTYVLHVHCIVYNFCTVYLYTVVHFIQNMHDYYIYITKLWIILLSTWHWPLHVWLLNNNYSSSFFGGGRKKSGLQTWCKGEGINLLSLLDWLGFYAFSSHSLYRNQTTQCLKNHLGLICLCIFFTFWFFKKELFYLACLGYISLGHYTG